MSPTISRKSAPVTYKADCSSPLRSGCPLGHLACSHAGPWQIRACSAFANAGCRRIEILSSAFDRISDFGSRRSIAR